ncbi:hypothetical protein RvY_02355 [Ramazzottius varieornatus]|uniref:DNA-directed DNA polymerase n=1 Tax=Ramazzottius varieornatus TaxID=947166 RepID=A0A1D1UTZ5_RAMVA|nr:hypothetical protein RvY_02355 [Ramazzottius varieornatus]
MQNGSSLIMLSIRGIGVRFIDSFSFLPRALKLLGDDFKLPQEEREGYFPHLFNTLENQEYSGRIPERHYFGYSQLHDNEKKAFDAWYEEQVQSNVVWHSRTEIIKYCQQDTRVLARCLNIFRRNFAEKCDELDCFEFPTMASAAITALQAKFLPENTIGIVPLEGYGGRGFHSKVRLEYLACDTSSCGSVNGSEEVLRNIAFVPRADPRTALFGGRVEVFYLKKEVSLDSGDTMEHDDYQSLYPSVNLEGAYGHGHPKVFYCNFPPVENWFGVVHCIILPSQNCYVPPLPYRLPSNSIVYTLCRTCVLVRNLNTPCSHNDDERALTGMWGCEEVQVAVKDARYTIVTVYELHHFEKTIQFNRQTGQRGLFDGAVRTFAKDKIVASGFPAGVETQADKQRYCNRWHDFLDITISPHEVEENPGKRFCAKIAINLLWGRFVMRDDYDQAEYCQRYSRCLELMVGNNYQPESVLFVTNQVAEVIYQESKEVARQNVKTNIYIGIRTTEMARLKLLRECLWEIQPGKLMYCDTDSALYVREADESPLPRGEYLGQLSSENKGKRCLKFAALGRKTYIKVMDDGETQLKAKGITPNPYNKTLLNYDTIKGMLDGTDWFSVDTENPAAFIRDMKNIKVRTKPMKRVAREIRLNAKYIIVFRGASDSEPLLHLGHQLFPRRPKYFEEAVDYCMAKDNGYLIINGYLIHPNIADDERLMTDIFGENPYKSTVVFKAIN